MWGKSPYFVTDNVAIAVRSLSLGKDWYREKLGLREIATDRVDDSGLPFVDMQLSKEQAVVTLIESESGKSVSGSRPILFTKTIEKAHDWLANRGVFVGPIQTDSGGNQFFELRQRNRGLRRAWLNTHQLSTRLFLVDFPVFCLLSPPFFLYTPPGTRTCSRS